MIWKRWELMMDMWGKIEWQPPLTHNHLLAPPIGFNNNKKEKHVSALTHPGPDLVPFWVFLMEIDWLLIFHRLLDHKPHSRIQILRGLSLSWWSWKKFIQAGWTLTSHCSNNPNCQRNWEPISKQKQKQNNVLIATYTCGCQKMRIKSSLTSFILTHIDSLRDWEWCLSFSWLIPHKLGGKHLCSGAQGFLLGHPTKSLSSLFPFQTSLPPSSRVPRLCTWSRRRHGWVVNVFLALIFFGPPVFWVSLTLGNFLWYYPQPYSL